MQLNKYYYAIGVITVGGLLAFGALWADEDEERHERYEHHEKAKHGSRRGAYGVGTVENAVYREECGACHFAYQPGLLPARSWQALMTNLEDHFGENAELEADTQAALQTYLSAHAADVRPSKVFRELAAGRLNIPPLRISELPGFRHEHREIPARMVQDNDKVGSFSHCARCHTDAEQGIYGEDQVDIPGYGRFED